MMEDNINSIISILSNFRDNDNYFFQIDKNYDPDGGEIQGLELIRASGLNNNKIVIVVEVINKPDLEFLNNFKKIYLDILSPKILNNKASVEFICDGERIIIENIAAIKIEEDSYEDFKTTVNNSKSLKESMEMLAKLKSGNYTSGNLKPSFWSRINSLFK